MTTAAMVGKLMTLSIQGDFMGEAQSFALHFAQSTVDVTSKDSDSWGDFLSGRKEWTIDFSGLYLISDAARLHVEEHFFGYHALDNLDVIITMPGAGGTYTGKAVLESMDYEGPAEEALTISGSLKGKGELVPSVS